MEITDYFIAASAVGSLALAGIAFWTILRGRVARAKRSKLRIANEIYMWAEEGNKIFQQIRFRYGGKPKMNQSLVDRLLELYRRRKHIETMSAEISDDVFQDVVNTTASSLERYVEEKPSEDEKEFDFAESAEECSAFFAALSWVASTTRIQFEEI